MQATQAKKPVENTIPKQECVECHKTISAPYARVSGGKWICSAKCAMAHDTKLHTLPIMQILGECAVATQ